MDVQTATFNQLHTTSGLNSLKVQNHIYGCYVIMEDLSQGKLNIIGSKLTGTKISFDFDTYFSEIGIRFGFLTDTKLILDNCLSEYKHQWITVFNEMAMTHNVEKADTIEDTINDIILREIKSDDAFFLNALDTGMLPHYWLDRAICLLLDRPFMPLSDDVPITDTAITHAHTEKVIPHIEKKRRYLATTIRNKNSERQHRKLLSFTRRNHGSKDKS